MNSDEILLYNNELDEDINIFVSGFIIMKGGSWVFVIWTYQKTYQKLF